MNKLLIAVLILGVGGLAVYLLAGNTSLLPKNLQSDVSYEEAKEAIKEDGKRTIYGSCNAIDKASNCIDYVGSIWGDNNMAELNCEGVGIFSKNTCPYSEYGGCQSGFGTVMETIAWAYKEGGGGYDDESIIYARKACDAIPSANWTMPEF